MKQYHHGWYFVAFAHELTQPITPLNIGQNRLMLVKDAEGVQAYNADCPHRGAHLAYGGELDGNCVVCPFHHYKVGLGEESSHGFRTRGYATRVIGGLVLVRLSDAFDFGVPDFLETLHERHHFVPAFTRQLKAPGELIIENGFDNAHFRPVHRVSAGNFDAHRTAAGNLQVNSQFLVTIQIPMGGKMVAKRNEVPLDLNAFSPCFSIAQIGGQLPYVLITGATPNPDGTTSLRLALGMSRKVYGDPPKQRWVDHFIASSLAGINDDAAIWEHMSLDAPQQFTAQDKAIEAFQSFCQPFYEAEHEAVSL
ncbi:MAG: Rieske 2Fe-2S domain-containing protein [Anaerolineales bacterium]|nr:Rieske 2Fe-2S domain-containing protein [Anaerolineales bacterium]